MLNIIKREIVELILLFFIIFFGLCWVDLANRELIHERAKYEAQFICYDFEIPTGFEDAIIKPD